MANLNIQKLINFRNRIIVLFNHSKQALISVIDAIAAPKNGDSVVKMSLSSLFSRHYTSIFQAIRDLFRKKSKNGDGEQDRTGGKEKLTEILGEQCADPIERPFFLLGTDCTPHPRMFAQRLEDRTMVYTPNKIGGPPVTIGHQYSVVACLPEKGKGSSPTWVNPLSVERVKSSEKATEVGAKQLKRIIESEKFYNHLVVGVGDGAYSAGSYIKSVEDIDNAVQILRLRSNRVLYRGLSEEREEHRRGRPKRYGEELRLKNPTQADEEELIGREMKKGNKVAIKIERWNNVLMRGKEQCAPMDVVRIEVRNEEGKQVYAKPLWLTIVGKRRRELSLNQIYDAYIQRYGMEHFFRFSKKNLLMDRFQTPEVEHEENWWWLGLIAYTMLHMVEPLSESMMYPWEKKMSKSNGKEKTPSQVQRDYERIIRQMGLEASIPKPRGKSPGRIKGQVAKRRSKQPVIKKQKKLIKAA
jgi:hypothetical protein